MTISAKLITRKATFIQEDLDRLVKKKPDTLESYLEQIDVQLQVERLLERVIGRLIDINYHCLKDRQLIPKDYRESFLLMGREGFVSSSLARDIEPASGLRNILAHEYDEIEPEKVYAGLISALQLIPDYLKAVLKHLPELD